MVKQAVNHPAFGIEIRDQGFKEPPILMLVTPPGREGNEIGELDES